MFCRRTAPRHGVIGKSPPGLGEHLRDLNQWRKTTAALTTNRSAQLRCLCAQLATRPKNTSNAGAGNANGAKAEQPSGTHQRTVIYQRIGA